MSLLLQCLQEVRARKGEQDNFMVECPNRSSERSPRVFNFGNSSVGLVEELDGRADTLRSESYSDSKSSMME